ncbi:MAG TPA: TolC family protein [Thiohalobacter sp.]|nr:TolC family protein [Thiohalobacter sp.]
MTEGLRIDGRQVRRRAPFLPRLLCAALLMAAGIGATRAAESLTLEQAIARAVQANPQLQSERFTHDARALERGIARGRRYPTLDLGAAYTHSSEPGLVHPITEPGVFPPLDKDIVNADLSLQLPLYAGGRLVAGESLAEHETRGARQRLNSSAQALIFNVVATFARVLQLDELYAAQTRRLASLEAEAEQIAHKISEGRATRLEALRVKAQQSQARFDQAATAQAMRDARRLLAAYMDRESIVQPLAPFSLDSIILPDSRRQAVQRAREINPRMLQARAQLGSAEDRLAIARADQRPQVDLLATARDRLGSDWEGRDDWDVQLALSMPLFDAGIRKSRTDQANFERLSSKQQLRSVLNDVVAEVEAAFGDVTTTRTQVAAARQGLAEADEALRIETRRYRAGRGTITDLLSAEAARWEAVATLNQAGFDVLVAQVRLLKAVGDLDAGTFGVQVPETTGWDEADKG